jgi:hypothetical protein
MLATTSEQTEIFHDSISIINSPPLPTRTTELAISHKSVEPKPAFFFDDNQSLHWLISPATL